jgi:hypothetical protein
MDDSNTAEIENKFNAFCYNVFVLTHNGDIDDYDEEDYKYWVSMSFEGLVTQFKQINPTIYKKP